LKSQNIYFNLNTGQIILYGAQTWHLRKVEELAAVFERKVLRKIVGTLL